ncbi:hypothetical protein EMCRGX_G003472 [Ephydatia muelleri]
MDVIPSGGEEIKGAPLEFIPHLVDKVVQLLDGNERTGRLTWHKGFIPANEIWLKIGGDKDMAATCTLSSHSWPGALLSRRAARTPDHNCQGEVSQSIRGSVIYFVVDHFPSSTSIRWARLSVTFIDDAGTLEMIDASEALPKGIHIIPLYSKVASSRAKYSTKGKWFRSIRTFIGARKPLRVSGAMNKARERK